MQIARLALATLACAALTACGSDTPDPPPHTIVSDTDDTILIEVAADPGDDGLRAIFDSVVAGDREDGGYFVQIDCATGGTTLVANRLANGRFPIGNLGRAQVGLDEPEFEAQPDRQCPAPDRPDNGAVTPERQPFLDALKAIDPGLVKDQSAALSRTGALCEDLAVGSRAQVVTLAVLRFDSLLTAPVDADVGEKILSAIEFTKVCATFG